MLSSCAIIQLQKYAPAQPAMTCSQGFLQQQPRKGLSALTWLASEPPDTFGRSQAVANEAIARCSPVDRQILQRVLEARHPDSNKGPKVGGDGHSASSNQRISKVNYAGGNEQTPPWRSRSEERVLSCLLLIIKCLNDVLQFAS